MESNTAGLGPGQAASCREEVTALPGGSWSLSLAHPLRLIRRRGEKKSLRLTPSTRSVHRGTAVPRARSTQVCGGRFRTVMGQESPDSIFSQLMGSGGRARILCQRLSRSKKVGALQSLAELREGPFVHDLLKIAGCSDTSTCWSETATNREHRLPSPQRGRGAGGEGDTCLLNQLPKLLSG